MMPINKYSELMLFGVGIVMLAAGIVFGAWFAFMVGKDRGVEDIYLDCRDRGVTVFHGVKYPCGPASNKE